MLVSEDSIFASPHVIGFLCSVSVKTIFAVDLRNFVPAAVFLDLFALHCPGCTTIGTNWEYRSVTYIYTEIMILKYIIRAFSF